MTARTTIQLRRGTAAQWTAANPTLAAGEFGVETDTGKRKVGDGSTAWASLPYSVLSTDSRLTDSRTPTGSAGGDLSGTYPNPSITGLALSKLASQADKTFVGNVSGGAAVPTAVTAANVLAALSGAAGADFAWNSHKLTGITAGTATGHAATYEQTAVATLTTQGDTLYASAANTPARLGIGTAYQVLRTNSGATAPEWVSGGMHLIAETVLSGSAANFDFTSIPATFRHLILRMQLRSDRSATNDTGTITFNNDTTNANYDASGLYVSSSTPGTNEALTSRYGLNVTAATSPANHFATIETFIPYYAGSNYKTALSLVLQWRARTSGSVIHFSQQTNWASTAAISRITLAPVTGTNFVAGSQVSLYGVG